MEDARNIDLYTTKGTMNYPCTCKIVNLKKPNIREAQFCDEHKFLLKTIDILLRHLNFGDK